MPSNNPKAQSLIEQVVEAELNGENHTAEQLRKNIASYANRKNRHTGLGFPLLKFGG